jgi:hypothetical protein
MGMTEISRAQPGEPAPKAPCVALVPVQFTPRPIALARGLTRPDPSFVTHLIAMAELSPQTRCRRRALPADVQAAYRSVARRDQQPALSGSRIRQVA